MDKGIYRFQVGAFECIVVNDGTVHSTQSPYDLFPNAPQAFMEQVFGERATPASVPPGSLFFVGMVWVLFIA